MAEEKESEMRFKYPKLEIGFWSLKSKLRKILCDLDDFCIHNFGHDIMLTSLFRGDDLNSVHFYHRGADVRSKDFSSEEITSILEYVNSSYPYGKVRLKSIIHHDVGQGQHFHVQVKSEQREVRNV